MKAFNLKNEKYLFFNVSIQASFERCYEIYINGENEC